MNDYLDFELEIGQRVRRTYAVKVLKSPEGETTGKLTLPYDDSALATALDSIDRMTAQQAREFGAQLFDALFSGEVRSRYDSSRTRADAEDRGLRVRLRVTTRELATIPWELLFDARINRFVCLSKDTPIVRYVELAQRPKPLTIDKLPLRVLAMVVSPKGAPPFNVERERTWITQSVEPLQAKGLIELLWVNGGTWRNLRDALRLNPHVFHFVGHGGFDDASGQGYLTLADEGGESSPLDADRLATLLGDQDALGLVLLNACEGAKATRNDLFSSTAATLVLSSVPAVLAMQRAFSLEAARELTRTFYDALAHNQPVDTAVADVRKALYVAGSGLDWSVPALFSRAPDGVLFQIPAQPEPQPQPVATVKPPGGNDILSPPGGSKTSPQAVPLTTARPGQVPAASQPIAELSRSELRRQMMLVYSLENLEALCEDVTDRMRKDPHPATVSLDLLPRGGLENTILELIKYLDRRGKLQYLLDAIEGR